MITAVTDTTPPTVSLTAPAHGATVSGTITLSANASDNVGVTRVEFYRDGVLVISDTTSPYSTSFDTTTVTNGSHSFFAKAFDAAGNVATSSSSTVTVVDPDSQPPEFLEVFRDAGVIHLTWSTVVGRAYQLQYSTIGSHSCLESTPDGSAPSPHSPGDDESARGFGSVRCHLGHP